MKKFTIPASTLFNLRYQIDKLTPSQVIQTFPDADPLKVNVEVDKISKKLRKSNSLFEDENDKTEKGKKEVMDKYSAEFRQRAEMSPEEEVALVGRLNSKAIRETDAVQSASKLSEMVENIVEVILSDDEMVKLRLLLAASAKAWESQDHQSFRDLLVSATESLDAVENA